MAASGGRRRRDRVLTGVKNRVLLCCLGGGGAAWAAGVSALSSVLVVGVTATVAAAGAVVIGASGSGAGRRRRVPGARGHPSLRAGTEQARLAAEFDVHVRELRSLRTSALLPDLLSDPAVEALVAAKGAREVALRVARAVDALDTALDRAQNVGERVPPTPTSAAVLARMYQRRERLLTALRDGLAQVQDVHAQLLELSATAGLPGLPGLPGPPGLSGLGLCGLDDVAAEVREVGDRLDLMRRSFAELDAAASGAVPRA